MAVSSWQKSLALYRDPRALAMLFLGISSGLPLALVAGTLSLWLADVGVSLAAIGLFALVRNPYSLKFLWSPLIDRLSLPYLSRRFGRRRGWALLSQVLLMVSIVLMGFSNPAENPWMTALFALLVAFFSASQDIVLDAFRIEKFETDEQGIGASAVVLGYRVGLLISSAGAIWLAAVLPWEWVYGLMSLAILIGIVAILLSSEPDHHQHLADITREEREVKARLLSREFPARLAAVLAWLKTAVVGPLSEFLQRPGAWIILGFIVVYKLCDAYIGMMANPFYLELGFSKAEIAGVTKVFGFAATLAGVFLGGVLVAWAGLFRSLWICGILQVLSNFVFAYQAMLGDNLSMLAVTIAVENVAGGMGTIAFVAYLSSLCNVAYSATQYALLSSLMVLPRDLISATSGYLAEAVSWVEFFIFSGLIGIPALGLLVWMARRGLFDGVKAPPASDIKADA